MTQLRDITGIEGVPVSPEQTVGIWVWVAVAILAASLFVLAWWWRHRRQRGEAIHSPELWAKAQLTSIGDTITAEDSLNFHTQISNIFRRYLELRFKVPALQRTTHEITNDGTLASLLSTSLRKDLTTILERCDLAKFAGAPYSSEECQSHIEMACAFVDGSCAEPR